MMIKYPVILILYLFLTYACSPHITYEDAISECRNQLIPSGEGIFTWDTNCLLGSTLPVFDLLTINNEQIKNTDLVGKYSIINFWFIACKPCIDEIPELNKLVEKYGQEKVNYIAIGVDSKSDIETFLDSTDFDFDHIPEGRDINRETFGSLWGFPLTMIADKKGMIIDVISGNLSYKEDKKNALFMRIDGLLSK